MNVTDVPVHTAPAGEAAMLTLTGTPGLMVIEMAFDVAGLPVAQVRSESNVHVTMSPLLSEDVVNELLPEATTEPLMNQE
ncbi:hypothetical protein SDC9_170284 [bioreactor metagenome]|uniref:Uncharacterized protein n=1 Tax=bioreactor metagenome TaxID=1076179 RepID=A0A645GAU1_9ZZZZ